MAATLSVVVPVYGTKRDLPACLESLRTQSLRDAEFLLVDDASPDGAGAGADFLPKPNMSGHSWYQGAGQIPFLSSIAMIIDTALETTAVEIWFRACWL